MENSFRYSGRWWLPENESKKIAGDLVYNPEERLKLVLNGQFEGDSEKYYIIARANRKE